LSLLDDNWCIEVKATENSQDNGPMIDFSFLPFQGLLGIFAGGAVVSMGDNVAPERERAGFCGTRPRTCLSG
jgi:hypothetical protein